MSKDRDLFANVMLAMILLALFLIGGRLREISHRLPEPPVAPVESRSK